jgi:hypothetical protein
LGNPVTAQIILDMPISTRFIFGEPVSARFISGDPVSARITLYVPVTLAAAPRAVSQRHRRSEPVFQAVAGRDCLIPYLRALKAGRSCYSAATPPPGQIFPTVAGRDCKHGKN